MPEPLTPPRVAVDDLDRLRSELGLSVSVNGPGTYDLILHDSLRLEIEADGAPIDSPAYVRVCTSDIEAARRAIRDAYGVHPAQTNTVDPKTMRSQGVLLKTASLLVTAVRCPAADDSGVPCGTDCSPDRPARPTAGQTPPAAAPGPIAKSEPAGEATSGWPALPINEWTETIEALHLWSQVIGKVRLS